MKNPFSRIRRPSGTYSPEAMELAHGLPLQEREESDKKQSSSITVSSETAVVSSVTGSTSEIPAQNTTPSVTDVGSSATESISEIQLQHSIPSTTDAGSSTTKSISEIPAQNTTPSVTNAGSGPAESTSGITPPNTTPSEADASNGQGRKKSMWRRFFLKLLCLGSGGNDSDSEVYHPDPRTDEQHTSTSDAISDEQHTSTRDEEVIQQDAAATTPSVEAQEITNDPVNAEPHDVEHPRPADNTPKKRGILYRFFSKLLCLGSGKNESEVVEEHDSPDSLPDIPNPQDLVTETYVPFERCDEDIPFIRGTSDTSPASEVGTSSRPQAEQVVNVQVKHRRPSIIDEAGASTSQQPITQLKKQRPASYYHIFPATSADEKAPHSADTSITNTQTSSSLRDNPNNGVSFSRISKNLKTNSTSDIATTSGSVAVNTQGKLQQKNASLPDLCSEYLPSGGIIDCAYNVPTNSASLHKVSNIQDLSEAGRTASTSKRPKAGMLRSSDASLLTIHEEHEQPFSAETFSDIRRAMKKINRSRFSEAYQDILSREHSSFAETPSNAPSAIRNDSAISKIIRSFEEKSKAASQNLPKDLPSTMHR